MKSYSIKPLMLLLLFCILCRSISGQCIGNFSIVSNGIGGDTLKSIAPFDTSSTSVYYWAIYSNSQAIFKDSSVAQTYFKFDTNGVYRVCLAIADTAGACSFDTCISWVVSDVPVLRCNGNFNLISNGLGGDTIVAVPPFDSSASFSYYWTIYNQSHIFFVDSDKQQTFYAFDTNGYFNVCLHINDSSGSCSFDTCKTILVDDAVYHPMLDSINIWHLINNGCITTPFHGGGIERSGGCAFLFYSSQYYTGVDTIYNSLHYKPIYVDYDICSPGYLREDVAARKIYFTQSLGDPEMLLYDFSLKVGDSVFLAYQPVFYATQSDSGFWHLDSIGVTNISSGVRRVFFLSRNGHTISWLEGVGSLGHPFYLFAPSVTERGCDAVSCTTSNYLIVPYWSMNFLSCFSHTGFVYFDTCAYLQALSFQGACFEVSDSCDYRPICGAIHEIAALSSFELSPNPTSNEVSVQLNVVQANKFSIILHDLQGKQVMAEKDLGWLNDGAHNAVINLQGIGAGFYLVECRTADGSLYSKLVIL